MSSGIKRVPVKKKKNEGLLLLQKQINSKKKKKKTKKKKNIAHVRTRILMVVGTQPLKKKNET